MNIFQRIIRDFDEEVSEVETKPCKYCECYHAEDSEFCDDVCEQGYKWEYEQEFYTSQIREQE